MVLNSDKSEIEKERDFENAKGETKDENERLNASKRPFQGGCTNIK